ncbi:hypothetical protein A3740_11720 [Oleiphilus sp. HI0068]|nr:hypothetical protein A3740_11720 [Oleiphilus sp. HI0068]KZZ47676.1 hypothetical protein A3755_14755 [Oleiphilus sp. HI0085]
MKLVKSMILKFVNKPEDNILSSQTLYECLFALINLYRIEKTEEHLHSARDVAYKICDTQLIDGGFDLGYDFIFGKALSKANKKEGTSPELLSITALSIYYQEIDKDIKVYDSIIKGLNWVKKRLIKIDDDGFTYAIPYAPDSYEKVHIINATSFALSSIASSIPVINDETEIAFFKSVLDGMYEFMFQQLEFNRDGEGFWPYFYNKGSSEELALINDKVDNYHMAQQLYHHIIADKYYPSEVNNKSIECIYKYLASLVDEEGFVPYTFAMGKSSDKVDVWGYASILGALAIYGHNYHSAAAINLAKKVSGYLIKNTWQGEYFYPIVLNSNKKAFDSHFYPRSDAWVVHSLTDYLLYIDRNEDINNIVIRILEKIKECDYKGLENHTITYRKKAFAFIVNLLRGK